jgi:AraC family transcriptional regulator of arabinose operon
MSDFAKSSGAAGAERPHPGQLLAGHFRQSYGYSIYRPQGTRDWLLFYTLDGEGVFQFGQERIVCGAGDVAILLPGTVHHYSTAPGSAWHFLWAHFYPEPHWSPYTQLPERSKGFVLLPVVSARTRERIEQTMTAVMFDSREAADYGEELGLNGLLSVLMLLKQQTQRSHRTVPDARVAEALDHMVRNMQTDIRVDDLARRVCMSPSRFAHLFKEQTGLSIIETLLRMRLREAARMLRFTVRPAAEIAEDVGFTSYNNFTKQFKAFYGLPPQMYRRTHGNTAGGGVDGDAAGGTVDGGAMQG